MLELAKDTPTTYVRNTLFIFGDRKKSGTQKQQGIYLPACKLGLDELSGKRMDNTTRFPREKVQLPGESSKETGAYD